MSTMNILILPVAWVKCNKLTKEHSKCIMIINLPIYHHSLFNTIKDRLLHLVRT